MRRIITFGTFDVLHIGHLRILERAAELGGHLSVGISTDRLNFSKKGRYPVYPEDQRAALVSALRCVDHVFYEYSLEEKSKYIKECKAEVLVMGDDWRGKFDHLRSLCEITYLPRTPAISTTEVIEKIRS